MCMITFLNYSATQDWTVYVGDHFAYDGREGAIGATDVKLIGDKSICFLRTMSVAARPRFMTSLEPEDIADNHPLVCDGSEVAKVIQKVKLCLTLNIL